MNNGHAAFHLYAGGLTYDEHGEEWIKHSATNDVHEMLKAVLPALKVFRHLLLNVYDIETEHLLLTIIDRDKYPPDVSCIKVYLEGRIAGEMEEARRKGKNTP